MKIKLRKYPVPGWAAAIITALWCEGLLHLWTVDQVQGDRFLTVLVFALGLGCLMGQAFSFLGRRNWCKWVTVGIMAAMAAYYLVIFFVQQFFGTFYTPATILAGAGGVANGFAGDAVMTVLKGLWRIALMLLPAIVYALFGQPARTSWRTRWVVLVAGLLSYIVGFALVQGRPADAARLGETYQFESAVNAFGLHIGAGLDALYSGREEEPMGDFAFPEPERTDIWTEPAAEAQPQEEGGTEAPVAYGYNTMDLDFAALAKSEPNGNIAKVHWYVASQTPTQKNAFTGLFQGKNLIFITAEALAREVIDPDITPTLYRLANQGIRFDDFYQPKWGAGTTSGEYANLVGLVPTSGGSCMTEPGQQNLFLLLGKQMDRLGYSSAAFHPNDYKFYNRNKTHANLGYEYFMGFGNGMENYVTAQWPQSDDEMMSNTLSKIILPQQKADGKPFNLYYMSVSGHSVYTVKGNAMSRKNYDETQALAAKYGKDWSDPLLCYMAANLELEKALTNTLHLLDEAGILEDTVIVISPDHFPYGLENTKSRISGKRNCLEELYGDIPKEFHDHNALIIWSPCLEGRNIVVADPVYSLDILPTVSNLFGLNYDSRLLVGRDALSNSQPLALWPNFSWKTDRGYYNATTGEFTPAPGQTQPDDGYIKEMREIVKGKIDYSDQVINWNYFNFIPVE